MGPTCQNQEPSVRCSCMYMLITGPEHHLTSFLGKYLTLNDNSMRLEVHPTLDSSVFVLTQSEVTSLVSFLCMPLLYHLLFLHVQKDNTEFDESKYESMGEPSIRVGDSVVFVRHKSKLLWLGHQV